MDTEKKTLVVLTDEISKLPIGEVTQLRDWLNQFLQQKSAQPDYQTNYSQLLAKKNNVAKQSARTDLAMLDPSLEE